MSTLSTFYGPPRRLSATGRQQLGAAVMLDQDWSMTFSSEDLLIDAVASLSDDDLEAAHTLAALLPGAIACVQIRRDTARDASRRADR
ncbi:MULTISPECIES: hypothetical protein [Micromonospora]|uniref:hypothetical protein n=1 Tax=Micromonospora TaxID=1873 RepID=UPI0033F39EDC